MMFGWCLMVWTILDDCWWFWCPSIDLLMMFNSYLMKINGAFDDPDEEIGWNARSRIKFKQIESWKTTAMSNWNDSNQTITSFLDPFCMRLDDHQRASMNCNDSVVPKRSYLGHFWHMLAQLSSVDRRTRPPKVSLFGDSDLVVKTSHKMIETYWNGIWYVDTI